MELDESMYNEVARETQIEWLCIVHALNFFRRERSIQRLDILLEIMLNLPPGRFVQNVRNCD